MSHLWAGSRAAPVAVVEPSRVLAVFVATPRLRPHLAESLMATRVYDVKASGKVVAQVDVYDDEEVLGVHLLVDGKRLPMVGFPKADIAMFSGFRRYVVDELGWTVEPTPEDSP
jgi:hypothetical protein